MSHRPDLGIAAACVSPEMAEGIRAQLERILGSQQFRSSRRCQHLLRQMIERTLSGDTASLKERTLGMEVFGREPDYDTSQDPVVRATAAEIRKKLAQYYQESAHGPELRIDLVSGSYIPELHAHDETAPVAAVRRSARRLAAWAAAGGGVLAILAAGALWWAPWARSDLELFWRPILQAPGHVMICMGQPIVYNLRSTESQDRIQARQYDLRTGDIAARGVIPKKDLIILADRYIALGDAECLVRISSLLERYRKPYSIRGERSTTFADLRENAAVLVGAFDNPWTLRATGQLRFTFVKDSAHDTDMVRDRQHPENTDWKLTGAWPYWDIGNDYAIVSRVLDATTDRPFVIAAGITQYGTRAAGEFLSNPRYFSEAVSRLPRDWARRNLQVVLWVPVVHRVSGHPRVLAAHAW